MADIAVGLSILEIHSGKYTVHCPKNINLRDTFRQVYCTLAQKYQSYRYIQESVLYTVLKISILEILSGKCTVHYPENINLIDTFRQVYCTLSPKYQSYRYIQASVLYTGPKISILEIHSGKCTVQCTLS